MKLTKIFALVMALLFSGNANAEPQIGGVAPEFSAKDISGKEVKLADMVDKIVVMEWHNEECPFVKKLYESNNMQELQKKYTALGAEWIVVNSGAEGKQGYYETDEKAKEAFAKHGIAATSYIRDVNGIIGKAYGAKTTPHMFVINKGRVAYMGAIDSIPSADKADIAKAENHVAKALDEVLDGKEVTTAITNQYGCAVKYAE